jgi:hypothetical protein
MEKTWATVDFPLPIPPVNPTIKLLVIESVEKFDTSQRSMK